MSNPINIHNWSELSDEDKTALLSRPVFDDSEKLSLVQTIIDRVRKDGDLALQELTLELDGCQPVSLQIPVTELEQALSAVDPAVLCAITDASERIHAFHSADMPQNRDVETAAGLLCSVRYRALSPVGLYIPGGSAPLISTILMLAIPANLAGCRDIVLCSPPGKDGRIPNEVLAAAFTCGVSRVFCVGGAQAVAAMAYGTSTIPQCDKILGPGNSWVTSAKQIVSQDPAGCAIDMPAGPSEVVVIADKGANAEFTAWDLLSQAEHGPDSQVILLTDSKNFAQAVAELIQDLAPTQPRASILAQSLKQARLIIVESLDDAMEISNRYAPEHLILNTNTAPVMAEEVVNAGSVFIGRWTPESLGDYCSGTNHVLPTYGWAKSCSALGVSDFMKRMTFQEASRDALAQVGPTAEILAEAEGLNAHRMAVRVRRKDLDR